jgi:FkbM family methyltransferase
MSKYFYLFPKLIKFIIYGRFDSFLKKIPGAGIVHVGANSAQERDHYKKLGVKRVIWIEADPKLFRVGKKNISNKKYAGQKIFNYLVTDKSNILHSFNIASNNGAASSIYKVKKLEKLYGGLKYVKEIKIRSKTLADIFKIEKININSYQVLSIDTEGSEFLVLKGAKKLLPYFKYLKIEIAEVGIFNKNVGPYIIGKYLRNFGYIEVKRTEIFKNSLGKVFDILYINKNINN